jgi:AcrR family transcriptional regulator
MRRLASELDTGPASLYVYVANTAELHGAVLDELLASLSYDRALIDLLCDYSALLFGQPSLARSVLALWPSGRNYLRLFDTVLGRLIEAGVPDRQAAWGADVLLQHATASAAEQGTRGESAETQRETYLLATAIAEASAADYPHISRLRDELFSGTGGQRMRWQFAALIQGISATATPG